MVRPRYIPRCALKREMSFPPTIREPPADELDSRITDLEAYIEEVRDALERRIDQMSPRKFAEKMVCAVFVGAVVGWLLGCLITSAVVRAHHAVK